MVVERKILTLLLQGGLRRRDTNAIGAEQCHETSSLKYRSRLLEAERLRTSFTAQTHACGDGDTNAIDAEHGLMFSYR
jgi:hypothetical protein